MKALIPAAGYGTRFLPASKTVPKEMLPIGSKPAIQLIVEEAVAAGADEVVIITSPDKPSIKKHFDVDSVWHSRLAKKPNIDAEMFHLEELGKKIRWTYQTEQKGLGHAVLQAAPLFEEETEPILILLGDALVSGEKPCSVDMCNVSRDYGNVSVVGVERVAKEKVSRYGIINASPLPTHNSLYQINDLVEKPAIEDAPSDLAVAGRYLLHPEIFIHLASQTPGVGGEIQLTDSIRKLLLSHKVLAYRYPGKRHDIGNPDGYLETLLVFRNK